MRLSSFRIKNFKSIIDTGLCHFPENDNIVVLAGQNEAGKSAVIEALDFFKNGPSAEFGKLQRRREENPEVECGFVLSQNDIENIFVETNNEELKNFLLKNNSLNFIRCVNSDDGLEDIFFTEETENDLKPFFNKPEVSLPAEKKSDADSATETDQQVDSQPEPADLAITSIDGLLEFLLPEIRTFVFYDSFDDLLPGLIPIKDIASHTAVQNFQKVFGVNFADIVKKDDRGIRRAEMKINETASDDLNNYWTQKLEENSKYNFTVKIVKKNPIEESTIEFMVDRTDNDPLYLEQKSNGFRWFSSFNLRLRALGVEQNTIKNLVILIDEPGQGLHEKAQKNLKIVLEELASKGAQIIYTTHYPNLIGTIGREFARIRLISNTNTRGTKVETVAQFASRDDVGAVDALSPLITAMGIQSVGSLLDREGYNVVVEGITDHYYLSAFRKILNKKGNINFLPACGVNNIPNLVSVLIGWGLNYKAVFDDDPGSGRKAYGQLKKEFYENDDGQAHEHIMKIKDCNGIEDVFSPKDFYKYILKTPMPTNGAIPKNSILAAGKKEALARLFLEKTETEEIKLDKQTTAKIIEIFNWLYSKFDIQVIEVKS